MKVFCSDCNNEAPFGSLGRCLGCGGILRSSYPVEASGRLTRIQAGPGIDRYRPLLPSTLALPYLGEGNTPLIPSRRVGPSLGLKHLYFKHEGCNPTGSFKDRGASLAAALASEARARGLLTASSGNAAAAVSAYSAAVGLKCLVLLEPEAPPTKLRQILTTGAQVMPVDGLFSHGPTAVADLLLQAASALKYYLAFIWAPVNPYLLEAMKTLSYEIAARLSEAPDVVISPVGGGDLLTAQWRGYLELKQAGLTDKWPRMIGVQSFKAPPLLEAFRSCAQQVAPLPYANSGISGINVPFTGDHALRAVRDSQGSVVGVDDDEVFGMQRRMALEEALWVEPVSAASVSALAQLVADRQIESGARVVCILSGAGFKDSRLAQDEAEVVSKRDPVPFDAEAIAAGAESWGYGVTGDGTRRK
ncbi:MAG: pyridoxal-phosphate dependent enzyme [Deltaproteobacteria bacterium]|nr:pyridoxal-phosphate dependent enzyme [Deltaproteobacteria bacterium]